MENMIKNAVLVIDSTPFETDPDTGETLDNDVTGPAKAAFELLLTERVGYPVTVTFVAGATTQTDDDTVSAHSDVVFNEGRWGQIATWYRLGLMQGVVECLCDVMTAEEYWRVVVGPRSASEVVAEQNLSAREVGHWLDRAEEAAWKVVGRGRPVSDEWIEYSKSALARLRMAAGS